MNRRLNVRALGLGVLASLVLLSFAATTVAAPGAKKIRLMDDCEPVSFNAVLGAGACVGEGETTFDQFIASLVATQDVHEWRFSPHRARVQEGRSTLIENTGGEVHTFTRVAEFGGGFVPDLNGLSGNPVPAPECLNFGAIVFIPAGGSEEGPTAGSTGMPVGTNKFQCCIHPWQRTTVEVVAVN